MIAEKLANLIQRISIGTDGMNSLNTGAKSAETGPGSRKTVGQ